jgi:hypothetical protein
MNLLSAYTHIFLPANIENQTLIQLAHIQLISNEESTSMFIQDHKTITGVIRQDQELIEALEVIASQYRAWRRLQIQIRSQMLYDFRLAPFPSSDQVCDLLQHFQVFVDALRLIADQIEGEIEATTDEFHTWFYD